MSIEVQSDVSLKELTWWKVGGAADHFVMPTSADEVGEALLWAYQRQMPVTILGGGSNVLISDDGVEGLVICMQQLKGVEVVESEDRVQVVALAGSSKAEALRVFLQNKLAPALFLCGLPGDMGGGVVMNAGVSEQIVPREFNEIVDWFEVVRVQGDQIETIKFQNADIDWHYRKSEGWQPGVVTRVAVSWQRDEDPDIGTKVKSATRSRLQRQPLNMPSCGSVFKNPEGNSSGALIDQAGLKGFQIGDAQVSEKHANFIVNLGSAKASDVKSVIESVRARVHEQHGIQLETEVKLVGRWKKEDEL
ncbi:MAG: UDP-N-acetylmuramate dehydrogenase [Bdellovibrionales bacterium]|nr:UDP-N-acetylmuramate dehydrogenase [Bdellovibrionales bacterium]